MRSRGGRDWTKCEGLEAWETSDGLLGYKLRVSRVDGWVLERLNVGLDACDVLEVFDGESTCLPVLSASDGYDVTPEIGTSRSWETKVRVLRQRCEGLLVELADARRQLYDLQAHNVAAHVDTANT